MAVNSVTYTSSSTSDSAEQLINPSYIVASKYESGDEYDDPTGDAYILESVVRGTTTGSQEDNEETDIECETSNSPIVTIVEQGAFKVEAEVADTQTPLLIALCNFIQDTSTGKVYARSQYQRLFIKLDIVFKLSDGTLLAWVYPKLQLNTKLLIEELNSNVNRIKLAGTAHDIQVTVDGETVLSPFYKHPNYSLPEASEETEE